MIKQKTIDDIYDLPILDVISKYVPGLKKSGANFMAKSPFTDEKSASFSVSPAKSVWKCFSTGIGGNNSITFLMKSKNMAFTDAVREIAKEFAINVEFDNDARSQKNIRLQESKALVSDVNARALEFFSSNLDKLDKSKHRVSTEIADSFSIGYALDEWKGLYQFLIGKGVSENQILKSELVSKGEKGNIYDFFRNRIVFPIFNIQRKIVGFSGRALDSKQKAKYLNSRQTILFDKSKSFIGIDQAKENIIKQSSVTIVEGNFDVTAMHENGFKNTVAACGTAFTENHIIELKKLKIQSILFVFDGDKAGKAALLKSIEIAIKHDLKIECAIFKEGVDPDDFFKNNKPGVFNKLIKDAVEYYASELFIDATTTIRKSSAESTLENFLATISDVKLRKNYIKSLSKKHKLTATDIEKGVKAQIIIKNKSEEEDDTNQKYRFPPYLSEEAKKEFDMHGFYEDEKPNKIGYWFTTQNYGFEQVSNFLVKPLFHIISHSNNRRLVEIKNKHGQHIIEVPSKGFVSVAPFQDACMEQGNFQLFGTTKQFKYISNKFLDKMPMSREISTLGWQSAGFFAFADGIIEDETFRNVDDYGIVRANADDHHYFLPAFSSIYKDFRDEDDPYESDRSFIFRKSPVTFGQWAKQYLKVHGDNGMFLISFLVATLFRDFIQSRTNFFPIMYNFGDVQTGKSTAAMHLNAVMLGEQSPLMLNAATLAAFSRKLAQFRNAVVWMDEYRNDIDERLFQGMKASWDGAGRDKGRMTNDNKTTSTKVYSSLLGSGQYLPTRDSNALFTRMIILTFDIKSEDRTEEEVEEFGKLLKLNRQGLSSIIIEILKWRDEVKANYENTYYDTMKELKSDMQKQDLEYNGRVLGNFSVIVAVMKILESKINFPFTHKQMHEKSIKLIAKQSEQINDSDVLNSYWSMIEYLCFNYDIEEGKDFKVKKEISVQRYGAKKKTETLNFHENKKILYIQFKKIHPKYLEAHKKQQGTTGTNASSIQSYMRSNKAFIGVCNAFSFDDKRTTAWMFDYERLNITLEKNGDTYEENKKTESKQEKEDHDVLPF